jgi:undecaprenyl diphosphate synthase
VSVKTVAIVMDGNRRWARQNNLPFSLGHRKGVETLVEITKEAKKKKVKKLIVYAFSSENWSREKLEVNSLMNLISFGTEVKLDEIIKNEIRMEFIGDLKSIPKKAREEVDRCIKSTKNFSDFTLVIALNYGGVWDIVNALKKISEKGETINAKNFLKFTELKGEEVEIFIRTGGEKRVSNFLLPNIGYSELFFSDKLWPDFNIKDFNTVLDDFKTRQRRFGK